MKENRKIFYSDSLFHPNSAVRAALAGKGLHVYDMRSGDLGDEITIEPFVRVDYWGSFVANFEITEWDDIEPSKCIYDKDKWIEEHDVEEVFDDAEIEKMIQDALKA